MSVQRSPTGGSHPDLSRMSNVGSEPSITFRKRKVPCDIECSCSEDLKEMRSEISRIGSLLEKYVGSNEQILKNMQENITDIKNQITDIKSSNERTINSMQVKIESLEADIKSIKMSSKTSPTTSVNELFASEQIIQEMQNRSNRDKNIILLGLPEPIASNSNERSTKDEAQVLKIISQVSAGIPNPSKVFRIGKFQPGKSRSVKVCFEAKEPAKELLRKRNKLQDGLKIFSDQTPTQQKYMRKLREDLKRRQENGETDLTIKYVNGTPSIIKVTKNYTQ